MCACNQPTINGEPGYSWDGKTVGIRQPNPPALADGDQLLYDCPGRCGGLDGHSHHFRLVKAQYGGTCLLVSHGGGDERIPLGCVADVAAQHGVWQTLGDNQRYWMLYSIYSAHQSAARASREAERAVWTRAAAEKRIKTRRSRGAVKVWIVTDATQPQTAVTR